MTEFLTASNFVSKLVDDGIGCQAFFDSTFDKDFILLAEFCELEGPKPIFTIPATMHSTFNLNTFAVRIMSVDCVSIMQTTDFSNFTVAGDIQVVLTEMSEGAVAYVQHFVLYDICARGFVRPFCLAYITKHHSELMLIFEKLQSVFSLVSTLFHFGNALSFINDIMLRLHHLVHLKNVLTDQVCDVFVDNVMLTEPQKKGITTKALDEATGQLEGLMAIFQKYVEEGTFNEHRDLFSPRYFEMMEKVASNGHSPARSLSDEEEQKSRDESERKRIEQKMKQKAENTECDPENIIEETSDSHNELMFQSRPSHRVPSDVISSILGKKYDKRLRSLNELCDVTCNVGLDILKYFLHVFTTKDVSLLQNLFLVQPPILEQATRMHIGTMEFPVISRVPDSGLEGVGCCTAAGSKDLVNDTPSIKTFLRHFVDVNSRFHCNDISNNSADTTNNQESASKSIDVCDAVDGGREQQHMASLNHSFLSLLKYTSISLPALSSSAISTQSKVGSFVNIPSALASESGASPMESNNLVGQQLPSGASTVCCSENSSGSYKDALAYPESVNSSNNSMEESVKISNKNIIRSISGMSSESVVSVDGVKEKIKTSKVSLLRLRENYSFLLPHIVYTLFIGRPLVIIGNEKDSRKVCGLVYALANFLPTNTLRPKKVYPWFTRKLTLSDLGNIGIVGMPKVSETKNPVPLSLRSYVSLLDYNTQILHAPFYYGERLAEMFDTSKQFNEKTFRNFIAQIWSEFVSEAYVRFVGHFTDTKNLFRMANASGVCPPFLVSEGANNVLRVKSVSCDLEILMYFVETLKTQLVLVFEGDEASEYQVCKSSTIRLNNKKCQTIQNAVIKRKK